MSLVAGIKKLSKMGKRKKSWEPTGLERLKQSRIAKGLEPDPRAIVVDHKIDFKPGQIINVDDLNIDWIAPRDGLYVFNGTDKVAAVDIAVDQDTRYPTNPIEDWCDKWAETA